MGQKQTTIESIEEPIEEPKEISSDYDLGEFYYIWKQAKDLKHASEIVAQIARGTYNENTYAFEIQQLPDKRLIEEFILTYNGHKYPQQNKLNDRQIYQSITIMKIHHLRNEIMSHRKHLLIGATGRLTKPARVSN